MREVPTTDGLQMKKAIAATAMLAVTIGTGFATPPAEAVNRRPAKAKYSAPKPAQAKPVSRFAFGAKQWAQVVMEEEGYEGGPWERALITFTVLRCEAYALGGSVNEVANRMTIVAIDYPNTRSDLLLTACGFGNWSHLGEGKCTF
jgi:hypothetical protein